MSNSYAEELRETFGRKFRRRRESLRMSQGCLSRRSGMPQSTLSCVEAGIVNLTLRTMAKLAEALSADVPTLLTKQRDTRD
jgi:transcriptional regulator with XRE-family HTH domain